jgi:two-component system KDP operon response regulator KdpE
MEKLRILVVDDDPKLVHLVRQVLSASEYDVLTARSGDAAVELCALEKPDLVLLDLILTNGMDGYQAARHIREFSEVPIIMLTARARETDILMGLSGADVHHQLSLPRMCCAIRAVLIAAGRAAGWNDCGIEVDLPPGVWWSVEGNTDTPVA